MLHICERYDVQLGDSLVFGESENDACMMKHAGISVSFCSTFPMPDIISDYVIKKPDFREVISLLD